MLGEECRESCMDGRPSSSRPKTSKGAHLECRQHVAIFSVGQWVKGLSVRSMKAGSRSLMPASFGLA